MPQPSTLEMAMAIVSIAMSVFVTLAMIGMEIYAVIREYHIEQDRQEQERLHQ
jgi:hypothetical protein